MRQFWGYSAAAGLTCSAFATTAAATPSVELEIESLGRCPSATQVEEQVRPLLQRYVVASGPSEEKREVAKIFDHGDSYVVRVLGTTRRIPDETRDCGERAQVAAVVLALTLEPAVSSGSQELQSTAPNSESDAPTQEDSSAHDMERSIHWVTAVGVKGLTTFEEYGPDIGPHIGGYVRFRGWVAGLSGSLFPTQRVEFDGEIATFSRYTLDAGFGPSLPFSSVVLIGTLGIAMDPLVISSEFYGSRRLRLDVGPMAAISFGTRSWPVNPFVQFDARWFPRDYEIQILPRGEVGRTPQLYLGLTAGIRLEQF